MAGRRVCLQSRKRIRREIAEPPMNSQRGRFGSRVERYLQKDEGPKPHLVENEKIRQKIEKLEALMQKKSEQIVSTIHRVAG
jgi:hypothetical protein